MHKDEFENAFIVKDTEKLKSLLLSEKFPVVIISPSLLGDGGGEIWVGNYLHMLLTDGLNGDNNIPLDLYKHIFQLKDERGKNWLHYCDKQSSRSPKGILKLLISFVEQKVLTPQEALELVLGASNQYSQPFGSLIVGVEAQKLFHDELILWMHSVKNEKGFNLIAEQYLSLYIKYAISRELSHYSRFIDLLISFSSFDALRGLLVDFLFPSTLSSEKPLFETLCEQKSQGDHLGILLYKICHGNPSNISRMIKSVRTEKSEDETINYLNILLDVSDKERGISGKLVASMQDECPDWLKDIQLVGQGSHLYLLILLMIKDALMTCKDDAVKGEISFYFFRLLFRVGVKPHFYYLNDLPENSSLWNLVFDIIKLCMSCDKFSLYWMVGIWDNDVLHSSVSLLSSLNGVNPKILNRFFTLVFSSHNASVHMKYIIDGIKSEGRPDKIQECGAVLYTLFSISPSFLNEFLQAISERDSLVVNLDKLSADSSVVGEGWEKSVDWTDPGCLYRLLLLRIRDTLNTSESPIREKIARNWVRAIFCNWQSSHIYSIGLSINENTLLWDAVFEIFAVCKEVGLFKEADVGKHIGSLEFSRICMQWNVKDLKRFLEFILDPSTLDEDARINVMEGLIVAVGERSTRKFSSEELLPVMTSVVSSAIEMPKLRVPLIKNLKPLKDICPAAIRRLEKIILEAKYDSFSDDEKQALHSSKTLVAQYKVYKNDDGKPFLSFIQWMSSMNDKQEGLVRDYLLLEACLENMKFKYNDLPFRALMLEADVLGFLRRCRHAFTKDEYYSLVKASSDVKKTMMDSDFILFRAALISEPMDDRIEAFKKIHNLPILISQGATVAVHGFYNGVWDTTVLESNKFSKLFSTWGARGEYTFVSSLKNVITEDMYQEIRAKRGHDFFASGASLLAELASLEMESNHYDVARNCLDSIPLNRRCLSVDLQGELVRIALSLYKKDKCSYDILRAIRYACKLTKSEVAQDPVCEDLLTKKDQYFEQIAIFKDLFAWDADLDKYGDEELYAVAFSLQKVILDKLQQDRSLESELMAHTQRIGKWLTGESSLADFLLYKNSVRAQKGVLGWMLTDVVVASTEKLFQELLRVRGNVDKSFESKMASPSLSSSS